MEIFFGVIFFVFFLFILECRLHAKKELSILSSNSLGEGDVMGERDGRIRAQDSALAAFAASVILRL
jgi:hypothetical protein